jgi:hypothetical protein
MIYILFLIYLNMVFFDVYNEIPLDLICCGLEKLRSNGIKCTY